MQARIVTWVLLLNFLNTIFFVEVPAHWQSSDTPVITSVGSVDSLVELFADAICDGPTAYESEEDFDDVPDNLKRAKWLDFFLIPHVPVFDRLIVDCKPSFHPFLGRLPSLFYDVFSPPPQA